MRFRRHSTSSMDGPPSKRLSLLRPFRRIKRRTRKLLSAKGRSIRTEKESELGSTDDDNNNQIPEGGSGSFLKLLKWKKEESDSDSYDEIDLSFKVQNNINDKKCHDDHIDHNFIDDSARESPSIYHDGRRSLTKELSRKGADRIELLAVSRTPSFNVMLHANELYSDTSTLVTRAEMRITWEDLENATDEDEIDVDEENMSEKVDPRDHLEDTFDENDMMKWKKKGERSSLIGVRRMETRGSDLVRQPSKGRNRGSVPLFKETSVFACNDDFQKFVLYERVKDWLKHFKTCDPRFRILKFFNDVANEGATGESTNFVRDHISPLLKYFSRSSVFTVWRPTSLEAIRRMMLGHGVGKGLDIKGKSAKRGKLSAFVPFLQIHKEEDKKKVRTLRKNGTIRVFFNSREDRDYVVSKLEMVAIEMKEEVDRAKSIVLEADDNDECEHDEDTVEAALVKLTLDMEDSTINAIDTYADSNKFGIEVQERLFWEGMVVRQKITRKPGSRDDTGRSSMPSFQDMNFTSLRKPNNMIPGGHTRAVIMQYNPKEDEGNENDPMSPLNLVMAYEENDPSKDRKRVIPVVSDFDCFIVGTRNVKYEEPVPEDQLEILKWMVQQTEGILSTPKSDSWTQRWLNVLKECSDKGFHPKIPAGGYADPKTRFIFKHAINRLSITGAVRHGAECFNYYFPQELDENLLVISDELPEKYGGKNWVYVNQNELKEILKYKIQHGFTFPLNPKWILCDPGWKDVYDTMMASSIGNVQRSLDCWYPPQSGIRESIDRVYKAYPNGFQRTDISSERMNKYLKGSYRYSNIDGTAAMDLAEQELKYYIIFQRAKRRLKAYLLMDRLLSSVRERRRSLTGSEESKDATGA